MSTLIISLIVALAVWFCYYLLVEALYAHGFTDCEDGYDADMRKIEAEFKHKKEEPHG